MSRYISSQMFSLCSEGIEMALHKIIGEVSTTELIHPWCFNFQFSNQRAIEKLSCIQKFVIYFKRKYSLTVSVDLSGTTE